MSDKKRKKNFCVRQSILGNIVSETFKGITRIVGWGLMSLVSILITNDRNRNTFSFTLSETVI